MQPEDMDGVSDRSFISDYRAKKEAPRTLESLGLGALHRRGSSLVLGAKCLDDEAWAEFKAGLIRLVDALSRAKTTLDRNNEASKRLHASMQNIRGGLNSRTKFPVFTPGADQIREDYIGLNEAIVTAAAFQLVCANEFMPEFNTRYRNNKWLNEYRSLFRA